MEDFNDDLSLSQQLPWIKPPGGLIYFSGGGGGGGGGLFNLVKCQYGINVHKPYFDQWSVIFVINYNSFLVQVPVTLPPKLPKTYVMCCK